MIGSVTLINFIFLTLVLLSAVIVLKLQKDADELDVIIKSKLDKLPPEDVKRFNKLFGK